MNDRADNHQNIHPPKSHRLKFFKEHLLLFFSENWTSFWMLFNRPHRFPQRKHCRVTRFWMCPKVVMTDSPLKMFFPVTNRQIQQKANPLEHHYPSGFLIYSLLFSKRKMKKIFFGESLRFNYKIFINLTLPHPCLTAGKPPFHLPLRKFIKTLISVIPVLLRRINSGGNLVIISWLVHWIPTCAGMTMPILSARGGLINIAKFCSLPKSSKFRYLSKKAVWEYFLLS